MSQENVEIVRRIVEATDRGDLDAMVADLAPEFEYVAAQVVPDIAGVYRGPEEYRRMVEGFAPSSARSVCRRPTGSSTRAIRCWSR